MIFTYMVRVKKLQYVVLKLQFILYRYYTKLQTVLHIITLNYTQNYAHMWLAVVIYHHVNIFKLIMNLSSMLNS